VSFEHNAEECLTDILDNAARIESYVAGLDREGFHDNGLIRDAVERCLERICEAVSRLGTQADELMPGQPASDIRGMGNRLRHAYDRVDFDLIWDTLQDDLPSLKAAVSRALATLKP
jgi:uncharacterized protein with HEPN domain